MPGVRVTYCRDGFIGNGCAVEHAHEVDNHHHMNGSGDTAFGGASRWPAVSLTIGLQEGREDLADMITDRCMKFVDEIIEEYQLGEPEET